jgi:hypothetical protein
MSSCTAFSIPTGSSLTSDPCDLAAKQHETQHHLFLPNSAEGLGWPPCPSQLTASAGHHIIIFVHKGF